MNSGRALLVLGALASVANADDGLPPARCEFAVELSYLQDYSQSYDDNKLLTSDQLKAMFSSIEDRYPESRFSVGSFVDKPLVEFGYPAQGDWFDGDWCLEIEDKLDNGKSVDELVDNFFLRPDGGGYDFPENQLGALHDVARVGEKVGWTTTDYTAGGKPIVRVIVMTTNSIYHTAGDGADSVYKLKPNNGVDETECTTEDYPSIAQVESALKDRGAHTFFLVGDRFPEEDIYAAYKELAENMPEADVSVYEYDSGNAGLIEAFKKLFDKLESQICETTLDVMFAQDVTWSYSNDMPNFQPRMNSLMQSMADAYPKSRFGMTTFGDKPLMPLGHGGSGDYCYRVESVLTEDRSLVEAAADKVTTTSGIDWRESQLDGLMSSALDSSLGWRAGDFWEGMALHRIVFVATDSGYHRAGDAAKAGYELAPHTGGLMTDELCTTMEYPTIEQMAMAVKDAGVFPVWVPTSDIVSIYRSVQKTLMDLYGVDSEVVELKDFDGDLVAAINHTVAKIVSSGRRGHLFRP